MLPSVYIVQEFYTGQADFTLCFYMGQTDFAQCWQTLIVQYIWILNDVLLIQWPFSELAPE